MVSLSHSAARAIPKQQEPTPNRQHHRFKKLAQTGHIALHAQRRLKRGVRRCHIRATSHAHSTTGQGDEQ